MSFGTYARKVRDRSLPYGLRVSALRSCVQLYRPIGFHATLGFLKEIAGPFQRDEAALLKALDAIEASRAQWHADMRDYAHSRRQAKQSGQRIPPAQDRNPNGSPPIWYGAARSAALSALRYWSRTRRPALRVTADEAGNTVDVLVAAALSSGGELTSEQRQLLVLAAAELEGRMQPDLWADDPVAYSRARDLLRVARLLETANDDGQPHSSAEG
ncbi:hypothetical protein GCE86_02205 [Micromonospora terminaliae]|uniref:Uncharacterized protein n=1 Tax=Micromonospora terminaliae TaxID=1914461 RepID=A0AAJ3DJH5_9ACTN|nr:hypothetical protein [Micromonospora terminaliae]NES28293.1 hypothetical protein [Micromonospora terminaliae]QGL45968.1 hypothetical protein GCE86_02205 [Micromonospora terminaliae]